MSRKERCPKCFKAVVGLYINKRNSKEGLIRKGYYCSNCRFILHDNQVCFKVISYKVKEYIPKSKR